MPAITKLRTDRAGRLQVTLDDGRDLLLSRAAGERLSLECGLLLSDAEAAALFDVAARDESLRRALHYLSVRPRSRAELERYLELKGYQPNVVAETATACLAAGHLDDRAFALAFVRDRVRLRPRGVSRLEAELRQRGIDPVVASDAVRQVMVEEGVSEHSLLASVARRRWARLADVEPRTARRRLEAYLRRRGFAADEIARTVRDLVDAAPGPGCVSGSPPH